MGKATYPFVSQDIIADRCETMTPSESSEPAPVSGVTDRRGQRWAALIAESVMTLTFVPYLLGYASSQGRGFMWLGYNLDDSCVYLSWMRQSSDGALTTLNLFTTDAQRGMAPNPLFWVLGRIAGATHLPPIAVYHGARFLRGCSAHGGVGIHSSCRCASDRAPPGISFCLCFSRTGLASGLAGWHTAGAGGYLAT